MMNLEGTRAFATFLLQTERGGTLELATAEGVHTAAAFLEVVDALAGLAFLFAAWVALVFLVVAVMTLEVFVGFLVLVLEGFLLVVATLGFLFEAAFLPLLLDLL